MDSKKLLSNNKLVVRRRELSFKKDGFLFFVQLVLLRTLKNYYQNEIAREKERKRLNFFSRTSRNTSPNDGQIVLLMLHFSHLSIPMTLCSFGIKRHSVDNSVSGRGSRFIIIFVFPFHRNLKFGRFHRLYRLTRFFFASRNNKLGQFVETLQR